MSSEGSDKRRDDWLNALAGEADENMDQDLLEEAELLRRSLLADTQPDQESESPSPEQVERFIASAKAEGLVKPRKNVTNFGLAGFALAASLVAGVVVVMPLLETPDSPLRERSTAQPQTIYHAEPGVRANQLQLQLQPWVSSWEQQIDAESGEVMVQAHLSDVVEARNALNRLGLQWPESGLLLLSIESR